MMIELLKLSCFICLLKPKSGDEQPCPAGDGKFVVSHIKSQPRVEPCRFPPCLVLLRRPSCCVVPGAVQDLCAGTEIKPSTKW